MIYPIKLDLVPLLENLVAALQPYANANNIKLHFKKFNHTLEIYHHPEFILPELTKLICRIIAFTPQDYNVTLEITNSNTNKDDDIIIQIKNTGASLKGLQKHLLNELKISTELKSSNSTETCFNIYIPTIKEEIDEPEKNSQQDFQTKAAIQSPFYKRLKEHLKSHFTSLKNLEQAADLKSQREGIFLKKVNAVINAHLEQEGFNTAALSKALALSRTQLYRKLKPLIGFAPANYIRFVKLSRAKELLDKEDLTVSEVAFKTGFSSHSHFSRVFQKQFGFKPSEIRQLKINNSRT